ncbi:nucleobase:cation symporter-2 family protein [Nocardioides acrostichi]|uniref:Purine permease n=1 Tax=Nocardioides acrostichi TaxID=2784339 RepID=A0A930UY63_9ACTN|nr:nucleobase:cation symporter-2 family protein [Nocardioides acrostichi]MBF4161230.1 purine permease [Nocardioides acrostichi]
MSHHEHDHEGSVTGTTAPTPAPTTDLTTGTTGRPEDEMLPPPQLLGYGVQHILSMFGGVIAVPFIIGGVAGLSASDTALLVSGALFVSGLATILQTIGVPFFGSRLPLVQGISFASVSTMITIVTAESDGERGLRVVFGAVIVSTLIGLVIAPVFSRVVRFFPAVVTGSVITVIGLSLLPVAGGWVTGQEPSASGAAVALAAVALLLVLVFAKTPMLSRLAILLALVVGTVVAALAGQTTWNGSDAAIVAIPTPLAFGAPVFAWGAIVSMTIVVLVIMVETTADILAVGEVVGTDVDNKRIAAGLRADMVSSAIAPLFNSFPATAFAQNVGLVALTGVRSRYAVAVGGGVLAILGLSPLLAAVVGLLPLAVLAGAGIVLFGSVTASGIRTLGKVDYDGTNNMIIVATAIGFGVVPIAWPQFWGAFPDWWQTVFDSEISAAAIVAFVLNLFFNVLLPGTPKDPTDVAAAPATQVRADEADVLARGGSFTAGRPVLPPEESS